VNGGVQIAQRYAVDWEQLDDANRIYVGPREQPKSYTIYGKEALAAGRREGGVRRRRPRRSRRPASFPTAIPITQADGNSIVLDLGNGRFALYAHLQPKSIKVKPGDQVTRGQVLALVGNSGKQRRPHLHFHVYGRPVAPRVERPALRDRHVRDHRQRAEHDRVRHGGGEGTPLEVDRRHAAESGREGAAARPVDRPVSRSRPAAPSDRLDPLCPPRAMPGLNFASVISPVTSSYSTTTGIPIFTSSGAQPTTVRHHARALVELARRPGTYGSDSRKARRLVLVRDR
jgi:murein DD-endopeptidase MepM/ murein hydrolase activator NlpD